MGNCTVHYDELHKRAPVHAATCAEYDAYGKETPDGDLEMHRIFAGGQ